MLRVLGLDFALGQTDSYVVSIIFIAWAIVSHRLIAMPTNLCNSLIFRSFSFVCSACITTASGVCLQAIDPVNGYCLLCQIEHRVWGAE